MYCKYWFQTSETGDQPYKDTSPKVFIVFSMQLNVKYCWWMASNLGRSTNWARYIDWPTVWLRLTNISFSKLWVGICIHLCEPIDLFRETFCSKTFLGPWWWQVFSVLALDSDDPSSNPAVVYNFSAKLLVKRTKIKRKKKKKLFGPQISPKRALTKDVVCGEKACWKCLL